MQIGTQKDYLISSVCSYVFDTENNTLYCEQTNEIKKVFNIDLLYIGNMINLPKYLYKHKQSISFTHMDKFFGFSFFKH